MPLMTCAEMAVKGRRLQAVYLALEPPTQRDGRAGFDPTRPNCIVRQSHILTNFLSICSCAFHADWLNSSITLLLSVDSQTADNNDRGTVMRKYAFASIVAAVVVTTALVFTLSSEAAGTLIGHWTFEGGAALDSSGNGHHGTLNGGVVPNAGKIGDASLDFGGIDGYVDLTPLAPSGSAITLAAWVNSDDLANCGSSDCRIASMANGVQEQDHNLMLSTIDSGGGVKLRFRLKAGGTTTTLIASSGNLSNGNWYHVAATYDGSFMRLYVDGDEVGSIAKTGAIDSAPAVPFWIGGNPDSPTSRPWDGRIDEVRLYDGALSEGEIEVLAGLLPPPSPVPPTATPTPPTVPGIDWAVPGVFDGKFAFGADVGYESPGSVTLSCPGDGYALLELSGWVDSVTPGVSMVYGIGTSVDDPDLTANSMRPLGGMFVSRTVVPCDLGNHTFYALFAGNTDIGGPPFGTAVINLDDMFLTATFFPVRY